MGLFLVIIFLTVIHEVAHDNVFRKKNWNRLFLYFFDILGANSYIWKKRHQIMHHNYPNLKGWDTDIEQSDLFKIYPDKHHTKFHRVQHHLMFLLYPLYLFNWLLVRDFKDFFSEERIIRKTVKIPRMEFAKLFFFKFLYTFYMFFVPWYFYSIPFMAVFAGFLLLTFTASVFALAVLLPPHANLENEFPEIGANLEVPSTWIEHQLRTTSDISTHNWFIDFFMGNFNYHVAHHLFPNLNYIYMKEATEEIAGYAQEHHLQYKQFTFAHALKNHYRLVRANALNQSVLEETF
ncbi:fatty acid desaturase [Sinomicrobium pectinilyticum]|uniref:Fatty acid desaturase n=2 Tax=Sinomicrobium pectinilyticum TaxID=1084421 RepID=A0A3N0DQJ7_SINP1|nr:fatty acid desaturase [Sinomicrobium pectinilyticum]